jgi:CheY-specific phosphatase CheX
MTPASTRPDLHSIGKNAFTEVLDTLFALPVAVREAAGDAFVSGAQDQITSSVLLTGPRLSGWVFVQLPQAFVAHAVRLLVGQDGDAGDSNALEDDAAGELANMVAGRVAAQLGAHGYTCALSTPSISRSASLPIKTQPGIEHGRTDLICEGHRLSLEIRCHYGS